MPIITSRRLLASALVIAAGLSTAFADVAARTDAADRFLADHPGAAFVRTDQGRVESVYGPAFSTGATPAESAALFVSRHAPALGARVDDLLPVSTMTSSGPELPLYFDAQRGGHRFTLLYYSQSRAGLPVFRADLRLLVRNEPSFPLVLAKSALRDLADFSPAPGWRKHAVTFNAMQDRVRQADPALANITLERAVIWAGYDDQHAAPRVAFELLADTGPETEPGFDRALFLIDALTGDILLRESQVHQMDDVTGRVQANVTAEFVADTCAPEVPLPLPYIRVSTSTSQAYCDAMGFFTLSNPANLPVVNVTSSISGQFFSVSDSLGAIESLQLGIPSGASAEFLHNSSNTLERIRAQANAYHSANRARDLALRYCPSYPTIATQTGFIINVNIAGSCNAFYSGNTINFYRAGGSCPNMAFSDIVHHEYGHHLVAMAGSGQGAYGEGLGDTVGTLISDLPGNGIGVFSGCSTPARTADNSLNYPCSGNSHTCGQLLSGVVWATRNQLLASNPSTYRDILSALTINSVLLHQGSSITPSITIDFLTLDDDDSDITNGTPHFPEIRAGFGSHNMHPPTTAAIAFRFPDGLPEHLDPASTTPLTFAVIPMAGTPAPGTASLLVDTGSGFAPVAITQDAPNTYTATLPAVACGTLARYYVSAQSSTGAAFAAPGRGPDAPYTVAASAAPAAVVFADDFSVDTGWVIGAAGDSANTSGRWIRVEPVGTYAQPETDSTAPGTGKCFVTGQGLPGQSAGLADVDGGVVTLTSPAFDLAGAVRPRVSYKRWFFNHRGTVNNTADTFTVQVSGDDGQSWVTAETVGPAGPGTSGGWVGAEIDLASFITPTSTVRVRFRAADVNIDDIVEAAIDDFTVTAFACTPSCPADWNGDGATTSQDFFDFLNDFFAGAADFNHDSQVNSQDFFDYVTAFLSGC